MSFVNNTAKNTLCRFLSMSVRIIKTVFGENCREFRFRRTSDPGLCSVSQQCMHTVYVQSVQHLLRPTAVFVAVAVTVCSAGYHIISACVDSTTVAAVLRWREVTVVLMWSLLLLIENYAVTFMIVIYVAFPCNFHNDSCHM